MVKEMAMATRGRPLTRVRSLAAPHDDCPHLFGTDVVSKWDLLRGSRMLWWPSLGKVRAATTVCAGAERVWAAS